MTTNNFIKCFCRLSFILNCAFVSVFIFHQTMREVGRHRLAQDILNIATTLRQFKLVFFLFLKHRNSMDLAISV